MREVLAKFDDISYDLPMKGNFRPACFALLAIIAIGGCGGGGGTSGLAIGPTTVTTKGQENMAQVSVNVETGKVTVTPLNATSTTRALYNGSSFKFNSTDLLIDSGELTRRTLSLAITNKSGESVDGVRLLVSNIAQATAYPFDQRANSMVTTIAGTGSAGSTDGPATSSPLNAPIAVGADKSGGVYVATYGDHSLRQIKGGYLTTISTTLVAPQGLAVIDDTGSGDYSTKYALVADGSNNTIKSVDLKTGQTKTVAGASGVTGNLDGTSDVARFSNPGGVAVYAQYGYYDTAYVSDTGNGALRKLSLSANPSLNVGGVTTLAGNLNSPRGIGTLTDGTIVLAELGANRVRLFTPQGVPIVSIGSGSAGDLDGLGNAATFNGPMGIAIVDDVIYVSSYNGNRIRFVARRQGLATNSASSWVVGTLAGTGSTGALDGSGATAAIGNPRIIGADVAGNILVPQINNNLLRKVTVPSSVALVGIPDGSLGVEAPTLSSADGYLPNSDGLAGPRTAYFMLSDNGSGSYQSLPMSFVVPQGVKSFTFNVAIEANPSSAGPLDAVLNPTVGSVTGSPNVFIRTIAGRFPNQIGVSTGEYQNGPISAAKFKNILGLTVDKSGVIYVVDSNTVRRIGLDGNVSTIAGKVDTYANLDGTGDVATFKYARTISVNPQGNAIYVGNWMQVKLLTAQGGDLSLAVNWRVSTIINPSGSQGNLDGPGDVASMQAIGGIVALSSGGALVADYAASTIRQISFISGNPTSPSSYLVGTLAGTGNRGYVDGSSAEFNSPEGIALSSDNQYAYIADAGNGRVRAVRLDTGWVTTIAGNGTGGVKDSDDGLMATFNSFPGSLAVGPGNYTYVLSQKFVRRISPSGSVRTVVGLPSGDSLSDGFGNQSTTPAWCIAAAPNGDMIIAEGTRIRKVERVIRGSSAP